MIELFYFFFCLIYFSSLIYVIFKSRSVDFFTLMVFSLSYYSFPLLLQHITLIGVVDNMKIYIYVYIVFIFIYIINFIFMMKSDNKKITSPILEINMLKVNLLTFITIVFYIYGVYLIGFNEYFLGTKKDDIALNTFIGVSIWSALSLFAVGYYGMKKIK